MSEPVWPVAAPKELPVSQFMDRALESGFILLGWRTETITREDDPDASGDLWHVPHISVTMTHDDGRGMRWKMDREGRVYWREFRPTESGEWKYSPISRDQVCPVNALWRMC